MATQTLKSANQTRVDTGRSITLYSASRSLGESLMCPAGAQELQNDVYGRPASQQTLPVNLDASCAQGSMYPSYRQIAVENQNRPYIPICAAGMRGGDTMGVGRDLIPQDLYGFGVGGEFVRHYNTANNAPPWDNAPPRRPNFYWRMEQPATLTHDAVRINRY
jgi:hypothetical protein